MTWKLTDKEFESVLKQPGAKRYKYLLGRVADTALIWSLAGSDGWVLLADNQGHEMVPIWPHAQYATACAINEWNGLEARSIPLSEWMELWTAGLLRDQRLVAAFPIPEGKGVVVSPERLKSDLAAALLAYE